MTTASAWQAEATRPMNMASRSSFHRLTVALTCLITALTQSACFEEPTVGLEYLAVNHTDQWVPAFLINGEGGVLNVPPQGGGGGTACCVTLPARWRPDLKVTIKWREPGTYLKDAQGREVIEGGSKVLVEGAWKSRTVPVPEYTAKDMGHFGVHFFPNDEVQVKVSFNYPWHKDYRPAYPPQSKAQP